jgi:hypothetical protein
MPHPLGPAGDSLGRPARGKEWAPAQEGRGEREAGREKRNWALGQNRIGESFLFFKKKSKPILKPFQKQI